MRQLSTRDAMSSSDWSSPGRGESQPRHRRRRPKSVLEPPGYYKPVPLRWPFLVAYMVVLAAAIGFLLRIQQIWPNSDHSAVVDGQHMVRSLAPAPDLLWDKAFELRKLPRQRRQLNSTTAENLKAPQPPSQPPTPAETPTHATTTASTPSPTPTPPFMGFTMSSISQPQVAATGSDNIVPLSTTGTSVAAALGKPFENHPGGMFGPPTGRTKKSTTSITNSTSWATTYTHDVGQSSNKFPGQESTLITAIGPTTEAGDVFRVANVDTETLRMSTESVIVGGTITAIEITSTYTPPARTTTEPGGNTVVYSPTPERVVNTITGIIGGSTVPTTRLDDGLTAGTSTLTIWRGGKMVPVVVVSTPGLPSTVTVVSIISGTLVTTTPPPETFTRDLGNGFHTIITTTPAPYVITIHGITTTMVFTTTPGRAVTTAVATNINGTPTVVQIVTTITPTPRVRVIETSVVTTINGTPTTMLTTITTTPAPTEHTSGDTRSDHTGFRVLPGFTSAQYFAVTYLPTIIAACLAVLSSIISSNVRCMQPFHALSTRDGGAPGADALTLHFGGLQSVIAPFVQAFSRGEPLPLVASLGAWLSTLLAPLAAEAIGFKVHGVCTHLDITGCGITPGVSPGPTNGLVALLAAMFVLLVATAFMLRRWETGVHADPWTLAAVVSMTHSDRLRAWFRGNSLQSDSDLRERLKDGRFQLAVFDVAAGADGERDDWEKPCYEYGIVPFTAPPTIAKKSADTHVKTSRRLFRWKSNRHIPFITLTYKSRITFFLALVGLIALIGYYFQLSEITPFELFMDSQGFGVKFFFALLGTAIALFWHAFFEDLAAVGPFARMARQPCLASQSILLSPCGTNIVSGAAMAVRQRHGLLLAAALMAGIAEIFLPTLLANVPFALTQTYSGWVASTAASLAVLSAMAAVLLATLGFSGWPHMPVDPRTLAGAIYYFSESSRLRADLCGRWVALRDEKGREEEVKALGRRFVYVSVEEPGEEVRMMVEVEADDDGEYVRGG